jgi:hypothetical protein
MRRMFVAAVVLTALAVAPAAHSWSWPIDGPVLRAFALGNDPYAGGQHRGVDIGAELGAAVRAPVSGTVSFVGSVPGGGRVVTIQTADGYAVTLLQLGTISAMKGDEVAEGAVVGVVDESSDAVTAAPHVHLGVRVATDPNGYVDPLGLLPARPVVAAPAPAPVPVPAAAPPAMAEPPPVDTSAPAAPPLEVTEVAAPAVSAVQQETSPVSDSHAPANPHAANPSVGPSAAKRKSISQPPASSEARRSTTASSPNSVATPRAVTKPAGIAETKPPTPLAGRMPHPAVALAVRAERPRARLPKAVGASQPVARGIFDRFADSAAHPLVERSGGGDSDDSLPVLLTVAAAALLVLAAWLTRRRTHGTEEAVEDARMMNRHDDTASPPEDPRGGRVAVCERPATHRPRGGIRGPGRHLRSLPPVARERRPHGQRDGRAWHAGHGRRGSGRRLPA